MLLRVPRARLGFRLLGRRRPALQRTSSSDPRGAPRCPGPGGPSVTVASLRQKGCGAGTSHGSSISNYDDCCCPVISWLCRQH